MNNEAISFRVSKEIKQAAEEMALSEDRSVASLSKRALVSYLESKGKLKANGHSKRERVTVT